MVKKFTNQEQESCRYGGGFISGLLMASFSFLTNARRERTGRILAVLAVFLATAGIKNAQAVSVFAVTTSTGATPGLDQQFLAAISSQFTAKIVKNSLVSNTYAITLFAPNPNYLPPPTTGDLLDVISSMTANSYVYGFASGIENERWRDLGLIGSFDVNCSSPTAFNLVQSSTKTFDLGTCIDSLSTASNSIYQQEFSTPTAAPGF